MLHGPGLDSWKVAVLDPLLPKNPGSFAVFLDPLLPPRSLSRFLPLPFFPMLVHRISEKCEGPLNKVSNSVPPAFFRAWAFFFCPEFVIVWK